MPPAGLLQDIDTLSMSGVNHRSDATASNRNVPHERTVQLPLAGDSRITTHLVDTLKQAAGANLIASVRSPDACGHAGFERSHRGAFPGETGRPAGECRQERPAARSAPVPIFTIHTIFIVRTCGLHFTGDDLRRAPVQSGCFTTN